MAKSAKSKSDPNMKEGHIVLQYGKRRVVIPRPVTHEETIAEARKQFKTLLKAQTLLLETDELGACRGEKAEISSDSWPDVADLVTVIYVSLPSKTTEPLPVGTSTKGMPHLQLAAPVPTPAADPRSYIILSLEMWITSLRSFKVKIRRNASLSKAFQHARRFFGAEKLIFRYGASLLRDDDTPENHFMENGDIISVLLYQIAGKPVIYLWSPRLIEADLSVSLVPQWRFSAVYPPALVSSVKLVSSEGTTVFGQRVEWRVQTHSDGNLTDLRSGVQVNSLFWEAETNSHLPPSSPRSSRLSTPNPLELEPTSEEVFDPVDVDISPENSVILSIDDVPRYIDNTLLALGLHTEARTSFITFWLPSLLRHKYIALRFIPQAAYARAAILKVKPKPDVVTRVFMVFKSIAADHLNPISCWESAILRAQLDVSFWRQVVGVESIDRWRDPSLIRVLEWGGMEIRSY